MSETLLAMGLFLYPKALWMCRGSIPRLTALVVKYFRDRREANRQHIAYMRALVECGKKEGWVKARKPSTASCTNPSCPCINHRRWETISGATVSL